MMSFARASLLAASMAPALAACSSPVAHSAPVGIELKAKSGDVSGGVVSEEKGITTEAGNPYGAFVKEARVALGQDPGTIDLVDLTLLVGGKSTNVTELRQVFDGEVDVLFVMDDSHNTFPVGHAVIDAETAGGALPLEIDFDPEAFVGIDREKLLGGGFKIVLRGPAAADFSTKGAEAVLQATFVFEAFE